MGKLTPAFRLETGTELGFDLHRIGGTGQTEQIGQPRHMGVDGEAGHAEGIGEHHIGGLASDSRQRGQFLHRGRHFRIELFHQNTGSIDDISGFGAVIAAGMDHFFQFGGLERGKILRTGMGFEKFRSDLVHHLVRALGGKDGRDQELERSFMNEETFLRPVSSQETAVDLSQTSSRSGVFFLAGGGHGTPQMLASEGDLSRPILTAKAASGAQITYPLMRTSATRAGS